MARRGVSKISISERLRAMLEAICRTKTAAQRLVERAAIVLMSSEGISDREQGERLGVDKKRVARWRRRWAQSQERLEQAEQVGAKDADLKALIQRVLSDRPRSGAPAKFTAKQIVDIIALACESPEDSEIPVSHWTPKELASEAIKRKIVESISPRHVERILKRSLPSTSQEPVLAHVAGQTRRPRKIQ